MLPKDTKHRRQLAKADTQQSLDSHLEEMPKRESVVPYTDNLFRDVAIEWLVSTDQVSDIPINQLLYLYDFNYSLFKHSNAHLSKR
jgi:hypothetical protein